MPLPSGPFSVPDPLADAWDDMVRRNRRLQAGNDPYSGAAQDGTDGGDGDVTQALNQAQMPLADWLAMRTQQLVARDAGQGDVPPDSTDAIQDQSGQDVLLGGAAHDTISAATAGQKLTGRPGTPALVAGALNTIAGSPNTSAAVPGGTLRRGAGSDVRGDARIFGRHIGAHGSLDPPSGRSEVSVSGIQGEGVTLPPRVRVYNTPTGELDLELPDSIKIKGFTIQKKGTYVIR
jgi:hypothetical protein